MSETKQELNKASLTELMQVKQIGKVLAKRIQAHVPFANWSEVAILPGMGQTRTANLQQKFKIIQADNAEHQQYNVTVIVVVSAV